MRTFLACVLTAVVFSGVRAQAVDVQGRQQAQQALQGSVMLVWQGASGCGGTLIDATTVLTASHCVDFYDRLKVYDYAGNEYAVVAMVRGRLRDLVLLTLNRPATTFAPLGLNAGVGEKVWTVGAMPGLGPFALSVGHVSLIAVHTMSPIRPGDDTGTLRQQYLQVDIRTFYGNSGGGLFNDSGQLIGVAVRALVMRENETYRGEYVLWSYVVGPAAIHAFLKEVGRL